MKVGAARARLAEGAPDVTSDLLGEVEQHVVDCAADVRILLVALRSPLLDSLGLIGALRHQAARLGDRDGLRIDVEAAVDLGPNRPMPAAVEEVLLAIASEAMTNAVRHAAAHRCTVSLTIGTSEDLDVVVMSVVDDGRGIGSPSSSGSGTGIGLGSMRHRAAEIGGSCWIGHRTAGGTEVRAVLPLAIRP